MASYGWGGPDGGPNCGQRTVSESGSDSFYAIEDVVKALNNEGENTESNNEEDIVEIGHDNGDNDGVIQSEGECEGSEGSDEGEDEDEDIESEGDSDGDGEEEGRGSEGKAFFMLGDTYASKKELVLAIDQYAVSAGVKLRVVKSDPLRIRVACQKGCPFVLYASNDGANPGLKVKTLFLEHSCSRVFKNPRASARWLAENFKRKVQERPSYKISDMKKDAEDDLKLSVSIYKCKRAKRLIMQSIEGSYIDEFKNLEAYCHELRTSNPGSDVSLELSKEGVENGKRVFSRLYLCFNAAKVNVSLLQALIWFDI